MENILQNSDGRCIQSHQTNLPNQRNILPQEAYFLLYRLAEGALLLQDFPVLPQSDIGHYQPQDANRHRANPTVLQ